MALLSNTAPAAPQPDTILGRQIYGEGINPFSADGSSKRAVRAVLALLYGITRVKGAEQSEFFLNSRTFRMSTPKIYCYVGNRLTQMNQGAASAFKPDSNVCGGTLSMAETNCARWRRESVPVGLRGKGCEALAS
jgi:hypothetical protein